MDDEFYLPVRFENKELHFPARLLNYGYSSKIQVDVYGLMVLFEPDEERNWRAVISYEDMQANKKIDKELILAITAAIDKVTK